jgi:hypothetical protein
MWNSLLKNVRHKPLAIGPKSKTAVLDGYNAAAVEALQENRMNAISRPLRWRK